MPKVQLMLTQGASYALKKLYLMHIFFSGAMTVIATHHGKVMMTIAESRRTNDEMPENEGKARRSAGKSTMDSGRAIMAVRR